MLARTPSKSAMSLMRETAPAGVGTSAPRSIARSAERSAGRRRGRKVMSGILTSVDALHANRVPAGNALYFSLLENVSDGARRYPRQSVPGDRQGLPGVGRH